MSERRRSLTRALARPVRGAAAGVRARPRLFAAVALGVLALQVFLPPLVLSVARTPFTFFTFNPWLSQLPGYLVSGTVPFEKKLAFLPGLALFWFSADSPYGGIDWGFAVDVTDLGRMLLTAGLFGLYFALWLHRRDFARRRVGPAGARGGVAGAFGSVLGLTTGPCSVVGCGAPVLPVVGLAFTGLSSGTLALLALVSRVATTVVLVAVAAGVLWLAWSAGDAGPDHPLAGLNRRKP